jgi:lysophospholipase L1-like esterase
MLGAVALASGLIVSAAPAQSAPAVSRGFAVYVAGDSTASIYDTTAAPRAGWGQALPLFAGPEVKIRDQARSGASSKSFIDKGLLDRILSTISPGDYLLISFGHNDEKPDKARHTKPSTTYKKYLRKYIAGARRHGAHPILVTPVERRRFDAAGHALATHGEYAKAMRQLGTETGVPVVDLTKASRDRWESLGAEATKDDFVWLDPNEEPNYPDGAKDNTHFQAHGAIEVARLIARDLELQHLLPTSALVGLQRTIPDDAITWPVSPASMLPGAIRHSAAGDRSAATETAATGSGTAIPATGTGTRTPATGTGTGTPATGTSAAETGTAHGAAAAAVAGTAPAPATGPTRTGR